MRNAAAAYLEWSHDREPYLQRSRDAAALTIPTLVPPKGSNQHSSLPTPWQGLGAQGVNNLASKLLLSLFPPTQPFFRLVPTDPEALRAAGDEVQTQVEEGLTRMERIIAAEFETMTLRVKLFETLKHLLVAGNACLHVQPDGESRVLTLDQYVCRRDPMGWLLTLIVKEVLDRDALPPELKELLPARPASGENPIQPGSVEAADMRRLGHSKDAVCLYTCVDWDPETERYFLHQELEGTPVPGIVGRYSPNLMPFRVLRYTTIDGEDYGRGMVEETLGDLVSLEALMKAIVEAAAIAARCIGLVDPAGAATADDLNRARNGAYVVGRATDLTYPQMNKSGDLQVAFAAVQRIEDRLSRAYLLNTAVQRQAERVTAEEIRYVAQELEATLGGVFSVLSQELQLPLVELIRDRLAKQKKIKRLPDRSVRAAIVTGVEALGRNQELSRLSVASQTAVALYGPEVVQRYTHPREALGRIYSAAGVDTAGLLKTQEEVDAENQQAQQMAMAQRLGPEVVKQLGPGVANRMGLGADQGQSAPPPASPPS